MSKRIVIVICIIVTIVSFLGGTAYKYEEYKTVTGEQLIENGKPYLRFSYDFTMPVDKETAYLWLDWAISFHQYYIDNELFTEDKPLELHQAYIDTYRQMKIMFQELDEEWGVSEQQ